MTIYIRKDGTRSGSNEPLPVKPKEEWTDCTHNYGGYIYGYGIAMKNYGNALTAWKESCKDFGDQSHAAEICYHYGQPTPDTIIENVDVETEKIWQEWNEGKWINSLWPHWDERKQYRTVLRIKDKP